MAKRNYVYFVRNPKTREIKIGQSEDVRRRLKELSTKEKCSLELLGVVEAPLIEKELHSMFSETRLHGEWFSPSVELLDYIISHKFPLIVDVLDEEKESRIPPIFWITFFIGTTILYVGLFLPMIIDQYGSPRGLIEISQFVLWLLLGLAVCCSLGAGAAGSFIQEDQEDEQDN